MQKGPLDWNMFKSILVSHHPSLGFTWKTRQGGSIELQSVRIIGIVGTELAIKLLDKSYEDVFSKGKEPLFVDVLKDHIPETIKYIKNNSLDKSKYYKDAKDAFSQVTIKDKKFVYITSSEKIKKITPVYEYNGSGSAKNANEKEFGELLKELIEQELKLDKLDHLQVKRAFSGKYLNTDFYGYQLIPTRKGNELEAVSIELKPSNKIEKISDAISQAVNYKEYANKTYIAIPRFTPETFYDEKRFAYFLSLCKGNGIGIISIDVEPETDEITGITIVLEAERNEISDDLLIKEYPIEFCALCNRFIVTKDEGNKDTRNGCGWSMGDCMKVRLEKMLTD